MDLNPKDIFKAPPIYRLLFSLQQVSSSIKKVNYSSGTRMKWNKPPTCLKSTSASKKNAIKAVVRQLAIQASLAAYMYGAPT